MFRNADPARTRKRKTRSQQQTRALALVPPSPAPSGSSSWLDQSAPGTPFMAMDDGRDAVESAWRAQALVSRAGDDMVNPQLYLPITEHWTSQSVPIMLNVYAPIEFLTKMYSNSMPDGPLVWAAHLFSRTYVTNLRYPTAMCRESYEETQRELGMYLGKTLGAVGEALKKPSGATRDDILATVWTLANYEVSFHPDSFPGGTRIFCGKCC